MSATDQELEAIRRYNTAQALLAPFKRITEQWGVRTTHRFQERIRALDLVAVGDLEGDWSVQILARETGVVVAEFAFAEYGRLFDMRKVDYTKPMPVADFIPWVESKVDKGQIKYSTIAQKRNLAFTDPRVIHDIAYRIVKSAKFNLKRKRWYNKGKEASLGELYEQLQEAMREALIVGMKSSFQAA